MTEVVNLKDAVKRRGPYAVWDLLTEDERRAAAAALWDNADKESRAPVELVLAKELKFRPHSVARLSTDRVAGRLVRLAEEIPENVLFQFLFHAALVYLATLKVADSDFWSGVDAVLETYAEDGAALE
jgi:hypothetical protein